MSGLLKVKDKTVSVLLCFLFPFWNGILGSGIKDWISQALPTLIQKAYFLWGQEVTQL